MTNQNTALTHLATLANSVQHPAILAEAESVTPVVHLQGLDQLLAPGGHQVDGSEPANKRHHLPVRRHFKLGSVVFLRLVPPGNLNQSEDSIY